MWIPKKEIKSSELRSEGDIKSQQQKMPLQQENGDPRQGDPLNTDAGAVTYHPILHPRFSTKPLRPDQQRN